MNEEVDCLGRWSAADTSDMVNNFRVGGSNSLLGRIGVTTQSFRAYCPVLTRTSSFIAEKLHSTELVFPNTRFKIRISFLRHILT